jgi:HK97 family phage major capsid protein
MATLPQYARKNAKWYCSPVCQDLVFTRLMMAAGGNTPATLAGGVAPQFAGYPIVPSTVLEDSTSAINNTHMLLFGDLQKAATMGSAREMRFLRSDDRYFELDQVGVKATERFDIVVHDVGTSSVAGPMVALIGKTS